MEDAENAINHAVQEEYKKQPKSIAEVHPIDRVPIPGYMGHRAVFRAPIKEGTALITQ